MEFSFSTLFLAAAVGATAGYVGALMILRRMALVGDALTHVALPGIGFALILGFAPFLGALTLLTCAVLGIWLLQHKTQLYTEALVGLFFTVALAVGILITPGYELFEALFGDIANISTASAMASALTALVALVITQHLAPKLLLAAVAPDLARAQGLRSERTELAFLLTIALTVALGISAVGTLLMGALIIIPALVARNIGRSFTAYAWSSSLVGAASAVGGVLWSSASSLMPPGAAVTIIATLVFVLSLFLRQKA